MAKKNAKASSTAVATEPPPDTAAPPPAATEGKEAGKKLRRESSAAEVPVFKPEELAAEETPVMMAAVIPRLNWKMNTPLKTIEDFDISVPLTNPRLKAVQIWFETGIQVTARNRTGVTVEDGLKAIHKLYRKKADDELELPVLDTIEWTNYFATNRGNWGAVLVKQKKEAAPTGKKKKDKQ